MEESDIYWIKDEFMKGGISAYFLACVFVSSTLVQGVFWDKKKPVFPDPVYQIFYEKCCKHSRNIAQRERFKALYLEELIEIRDLVGLTDVYKKKK